MDRWSLRRPSAVALVDDVESELAATRKYLEASGLVVVATAAEADVQRVIKERTSGLFLDERLDHFSIRAVDVAREYAARNPGRPIFHISNFFGPAFHDKLKWKVSPLSPVYTVNKQELTEQRMSEWISEQLSKAAANLPPARFGRVAIEAPTLDEAAVGALSIRPEEWGTLSIDEQDAVSDAVAEALGGHLRRVFDNSSAEWIAIGGPTGRILRWSDSSGYPPSQELLDEIEANEGVLPFVFVRQLDVDAINIEGVPWPGSGRNEFYPSIHAEFIGSELNEPVELLFDTGSDANYISKELAQKARLVLGKFPFSGFRLAQLVQYRQGCYPVNLVDGRGIATGQTDFRVVRNWDSTIGEGKALPGLLSNRVLVDLQVALRICGRTKTIQLDDSADG